uniref:Uncharacterized protein n=1 Tax=Kalanchoe fedtschenkoi TaxID=63787 RepID=A0A7N0RJE4_KALFE
MGEREALLLGGQKAWARGVRTFAGREVQGLCKPRPQRQIQERSSGSARSRLGSERRTPYQA